MSHTKTNKIYLIKNFAKYLLTPYPDFSSSFLFYLSLSFSVMYRLFPCTGGERERFTRGKIRKFFRAQANFNIWRYIFFYSGGLFSYLIWYSIYRQICYPIKTLYNNIVSYLLDSHILYIYYIYITIAKKRGGGII